MVDTKLHLVPVRGSSSVLTREQVVGGIKRRLLVLSPEGEVAEATSERGRAFAEANPTLDGALARILDEAPPRKPPATQTWLSALELGGPDPASQPGHYRFFPKGTLVFDLLRDWQELILRDGLKSTEIRTPVLYDWADKQFRDEAGTFHERLYFARGGSDRDEMVLRFSGDFGLFSLMRKMRLTHRQLPVRIYELVDSFRFERHGELRGLQRCRALTLFDWHSVCGGVEQALSEYDDFFECNLEVAEAWGFTPAPAFTVVQDFYERALPFVTSLAQRARSPVLLEVLSSPKHYWCFKHTMYDELGDKFANLQLDTVNAGRFGFSYAAPAGRLPLVLLHGSLSSIHRWLNSTLDRTARQNSPRWPVWLAPTQLRLIPIAPSHLESCLLIARELEGRVRVDCDDRAKPLGWRTHQAKAEWVPFVAVIGDDEIRSGRFRICGASAEEIVTSDDAAKRIGAASRGMPFRPLHPVLVSRQVRFV